MTPKVSSTTTHLFFSKPCYTSRFTDGSMEMKFPSGLKIHIPPLITEEPDDGVPMRRQFDHAVLTFVDSIEPLFAK